MQDSEKRGSNGVIESYQYLRRQAKILVRQLLGLPDLFLRPWYTNQIAERSVECGSSVHSQR